MTTQAKRLMGEFVGVVEKEVGKLQLRLLQLLSSATPVDTGFARSGWTPGVGSPIADASRRPADEAAARSVARSRGEVNKSKALALARAYKVTQGPAFLSNATPYIVALNEGSSAQAPAKFIDRSIEIAVVASGGSVV